MSHKRQFEIYGEQRRATKKELHALKRFVKTFWQWEDVDRVYGGGMSDEECERKIQSANKKIKSLERQLAKKFVD